MINPYDTNEPFLWAGDYLTYRGRIIGWVEHIDDAHPHQTSWWVYRLIRDDGEVTLDLPWRHSSDHYKSGAMGDLEKWLSRMIGQHQDWLDAFMAAPVPR
jgi:hypothetical protein